MINTLDLGKPFIKGKGGPVVTRSKSSSVSLHNAEEKIQRHRVGEM